MIVKSLYVCCIPADMNPADVRDLCHVCVTAVPVKFTNQFMILQRPHLSRELVWFSACFDHWSQTFIMSSFFRFGCFLKEKAGPGSVGWVKRYLDVLGLENSLACLLNTWSTCAHHTLHTPSGEPDAWNKSQTEMNNFLNLCICVFVEHHN